MAHRLESRADVNLYQNTKPKKLELTFFSARVFIALWRGSLSL